MLPDLSRVVARGLSPTRVVLGGESRSRWDPVMSRNSQLNPDCVQIPPSTGFPVVFHSKNRLEVGAVYLMRGLVSGLSGQTGGEKGVLGGVIRGGVVCGFFWESQRSKKWARAQLDREHFTNTAISMELTSAVVQSDGPVRSRGVLSWEPESAGTTYGNNERLWEEREFGFSLDLSISISFYSGG